MEKLLGERACFNRLNEYFMDNYGKYDLTAEWHSNDTMNVWTCDIYELGKTIEFTCDRKTGDVSEESRKLENKERGKQR